AGNHDLFSTLLSETGRHRIICTMWTPVNPPKNPEKRLAAMLHSVAGSGQFGAVLLTGLPYCWLAGMDYDGLARSVSSGAPVTAIPAKSMDSDWLDGYDMTLEALARAMPKARPGKRAKNRVALVGYMFDRNECDHTANLKELTRLLKASGLEVVSIWPSGGSVAELALASEASLIVSLPYGRKAARTLAEKYGARLLETGLPLGLKGTSAWLAAVRRAAGLPGDLPAEVLEEERDAARATAPALRALLHKKVLFAGDPYLYPAFASFAAELCISLPLVFLDSSRRPLGAGAAAGTVLFAPSTEDAKAARGTLSRYQLPDLAVVNSFALTEGFADGLPFVELGFPSYGHHCLLDEPFLGFSGARALASRLLNSLQTRSKASSSGPDRSA
ncbi:MAG: nitrogenase component 1, partial [Elusimicrobiota bacterium]|nr:nitrogenase component 1 [Elusimicrobiota bacterium]